MEDELTAIRRLGYRDFVGGMWDEIGRRQFQFLIDQGLRPNHYFLDVGCGALRGGVHLIDYLDRGHYLGIDKHEELVRTGLEQELGPRLREERAPEIVVSDGFEFDRLSRSPDYALAHSLFTHLDESDIRLCLSRLRKFVRPGCRFFATYFEVPEAVDNPAASASREMFDYTAEQMVEMGESQGWRTSRLGEWGHPRGQLMMLYETPAPARRRFAPRD